ncbi:Uncharacterized protein PBTT_05065 [Plasmodiophora brassicae]
MTSKLVIAAIIPAVLLITVKSGTSWKADYEANIRTGCAVSLDQCIPVIAAILEMAIVPEDKYDFILDQLSLVLSLEMAQFERAIATMRFYDEAGVRSNRVLLQAIQQRFAHVTADDLSDVVYVEFRQDSADSYSKIRKPRQPDTSNEQRHSVDGQEILRTTEHRIVKSQAGGKATKEDSLHRDCDTSQVARADLSNGNARRDLVEASSEESESHLGETLRIAQLYDRRAMDAEADQMRLELNRTTSRLELCQQKLVNLTTTLDNAKISSLAALNKYGKQMLGVGLATGAATASTVVYGVSRLVKPTTGGHAPVLQAAQQRSAGIVSALSGAVAGGFAMKAFQAATVTKASKPSGSFAHRTGSPHATPDCSPIDVRTIGICILAGVCATLLIVLVVSVAHFKRRLKEMQILMSYADCVRCGHS